MCVAPTVLEIPIAGVPSPSGLGYILSRLWRSGFGAADLLSVSGGSGILIIHSWFVGWNL